jgi:hypothetical protein
MALELSPKLKEMLRLIEAGDSPFRPSLESAKANIASARRSLGLNDRHQLPTR